MNYFERLVGRIWKRADSRGMSGSYERIPRGGEVYVDPTGTKRSAVIGRSVGTDGVVESMVGLPDPDVVYPRPRIARAEGYCEKFARTVAESGPCIGGLDY